MSGSFVAVVFITLVLLVFWRATALVLGAVLVAGLLNGLNLVPQQLRTATPPPAVEQPVGPSGPANPLGIRPSQ